MPITKLSELKEQYLETIELIRGHLREELGKTGPIQIEINKLERIAAYWKINRYFKQLAQDKIIEPVEEIQPAQFNEENPDAIELVCLKTIEEIQDYRHSLQGQGGHFVQFPVSSWSVLEIRFMNDQEVILTANEPGGVVQKSFTHGDMGCAKKIGGQPDKNWKFLTLLARSEGSFSLSDRHSSSRNTMATRKRELVKKLQAVFCVPSDPFEPYRENNAYKLKFPISYLSTEE
jgi:hypothetical protein